MRQFKFGAIIVLLIFFCMGCAEKWTFQFKVPRMTKEELKPLLGDPEIIILDVRVHEEWKESKWKIQDAVRGDPEKDIHTWADKYSKEKTLVFY